MRDKSKPVGLPRKGVNTRMADDLRQMLEQSAAATHRTLGNEIEHRLRESFSAQADLRTLIREEIRAALGIVGPFADPAELVASLRAHVAALPDEDDERRLYGPRSEAIGMRKVHDSSAMSWRV